MDDNTCPKKSGSINATTLELEFIAEWDRNK